MIKIDDNGLWRGEIGVEVRKLERLLFDLNLLHSGDGYPPHGEFSKAKLIMNPELVAVSSPCLAGMMIGGDAGAEPGRTGIVKIIAGDGSWVRCSDALYRIEVHK